jgi:RNA polymerase sigma-70 factor (ECF subfamily)
MDRKRLSELLRRLQETDDERILGEIIEMTQDYVLAYARRLTGDQHLAEDVVQTAFTAFVRRYEAIETDVLAWLLGVVRNVWKGELRRRAEETRLLERLLAAIADSGRHPDILERLANRDSRRALAKELRSALTLLSPRERECVWLRYAEHTRPPEIADRLALSVTSVYRYCSAGLRKLRERGVYIDGFT